MHKFKIMMAIPVLITLIVIAAHAQNVAVSNELTITTNAGEAQSTVVPPGHPKCQEGRFLVTNDRFRPPSGVVMGRKLDDLTNSNPIASTFDMGSLAASYDLNDLVNAKYWFGTNDHDLLTLPNGDVLYITGAFTRMPLAPPGGRPLPIWMGSLFKDTFRAGVCAASDQFGNCTKTFDFGPNARSNVLVWKSTDCGENFSFVAEMDPARFGGGTCALPQFRIKANCKKGEDCRIPTSPWDMGGSDGQLARVDPATGQVFMTFQCVGYTADDTSKMSPLLDPNKKINRTLVMVFDPSSSKWSSLGYLDQAAWRFSLLPFKNELDFGYASSVLTGKRNAQGNYTFDSTGTPSPTGAWNWMGEWNFKDDAGNSDVPVTLIGSNVLAVPVLARTPDPDTALLAFPDNFGAKGWGYRVVFYDRAAGKMTDATDADSILPVTANKNNLVFHLAVADPGSGPVLLYWTDLDSATKKVVVRGRLITSKDKYTNDFTISQSGDSPTSFTLAGNEYWYGDYHTAGAYLKKFSRTEGQGKFVITLATTTRYDYYPMWIEPGNTMRYARVEYATRSALLSTMANVQKMQVNERTIDPNRWKPKPPPVELINIKRQVRPMTIERDERQRTQRVLRPLIQRP